jgi:cystathionine beta-lyase/cystathionine gamma-synthase
MITSQEAKEYLLLKETNTQQELAIIRRFIYDVKGVDVGVIIINTVHPFQIQHNLALIQVAIDSATKFYYT